MSTQTFLHVFIYLFLKRGSWAILHIVFLQYGIGIFANLKLDFFILFLTKQNNKT